MTGKQQWGIGGRQMGQATTQEGRGKQQQIKQKQRASNDDRASNDNGASNDNRASIDNGQVTKRNNKPKQDCLSWQ